MYAKTLNGEHVNPTAMGDFLKTFVDKGKENLEAIAERVRQGGLEDREANGQATIVVVASEDNKVEMKLTYSKRLL